MVGSKYWKEEYPHLGIKKRVGAGEPTRRNAVTSLFTTPAFGRLSFLFGRQSRCEACMHRDEQLMHGEEAGVKRNPSADSEEPVDGARSET